MGGAEWLHFSVQDGIFAPKISLGMNTISDARETFPDTIIDVKLSIIEPEKLVSSFASAGADVISIHPESTKQLGAAIDKIERAGCSPGIVLNPGTPVSCLECLAGEIDVIVLMLVNPGWGGKKYEKVVLDKIEKIKKIYGDAGLDVPHIEIDGGVSIKSAQKFASAGANVFVIGKDVFNSIKSPEALVEDFLNECCL